MQLSCSLFLGGSISRTDSLFGWLFKGSNCGISQRTLIYISRLCVRFFYCIISAIIGVYNVYLSMWPPFKGTIHIYTSDPIIKLALFPLMEFIVVLRLDMCTCCGINLTEQFKIAKLDCLVD